MRRGAAWLAICALAATGGGARALDLTLPPSARTTAETESAPDSFALPTGPFADGTLPVREVTGRVTRRAWQVPVEGLTTFQLMEPLEAQILDAGYEPILQCADRACGGFDFRYAADILAAPAMHVDLFDYRVLTAARDEGEATSYVMLLVSRAAGSGYVQVVLVTPGDDPGLAVSGPSEGTPAAAPPPAGGVPDMATRLESRGHAVLRDLVFATGSSDLSEGAYASLKALAAYLADNPDRRVALVGHTDAEGALDGNIALSRRRAQSVLERLVEKYGIPRAQLDAEGMGYLAPVASNLTAEGREANRRVEAVLLNTQ
ncbi:MAG: OmpA family protein [Pseudooceanicola sp.]